MSTFEKLETAERLLREVREKARQEGDVQLAWSSDQAISMCIYGVVVARRSESKPVNLNPALGGS